MVPYWDSGNCEFCGKYNVCLNDHHLIPRWLGGSSEDIIRVCKSCHNKLETRMRNFVLYGAFNSPSWHSPWKALAHSNDYNRRNREKVNQKSREHCPKWRKKHPYYTTAWGQFTRAINAYPGISYLWAEKWKQNMEKKGQKITPEAFEKYRRSQEKEEQKLLQKKELLQKLQIKKPIQAYHLLYP